MPTLLFYTFTAVLGNTDTTVGGYRDVAACILEAHPRSQVQDATVSTILITDTQLFVQTLCMHMCTGHSGDDGTGSYWRCHEAVSYDDQAALPERDYQSIRLIGCGGIQKGKARPTR